MVHELLLLLVDSLIVVVTIGTATHSILLSVFSLWLVATLIQVKLTVVTATIEVAIHVHVALGLPEMLRVGLLELLQDLYSMLGL